VCVCVCVCVRIHTSEKPYECSQCDFRNLSTLATTQRVWFKVDYIFSIYNDT
jgi:hypothetical protein